jgi:hypothetical protein
VVEDSPVHRAGIQAGDVITGIASYPVHNMQDFYNAEGQLPTGEKKRLSFLRGARTMEVSISTAALRELDGGKIDYRLDGARRRAAASCARTCQGVLLSKLAVDSLLAPRVSRWRYGTGANRQTSGPGRFPGINQQRAAVAADPARRGRLHRPD